MRKNHNRGDHIVGIGRRARMADLRGWHLRAHAWLMGVGGTCARGRGVGGTWARGMGVGGTCARGRACSVLARARRCEESHGAHGGVR
mgnify:CR=1 FL=1